MAAVEALAHVLSEDAGPAQPPGALHHLFTLLGKLPEGEAERLAARSQELRKSAEKVAAVQRVNAQMIQTNLQLAAALTRHVVDPTEHYHSNGTQADKLPASQLDQRI